jgi:hypothetical protein
MNVNPALQNSGRVVWNGTVTTPVDLRRHIRFGFSFEVKTDIVTDAVFNVQAAPADDADYCVPGTFYPVADIVICDYPAIPQEQATIVIPAGTPAGSVCSGTLPCKPDAFVQLTAAGGDTANVVAVVVLSGPR